MKESPDLERAGYAEYHTLIHSVLARIYERKAADAAMFRLMAAHGAFKVAEEAGHLCNCEDIKDLIFCHGRIETEGFAILDGEYSRDSIIISITLLDSFLSDLTRFLLLLIPDAIPKDRQVRIADILDKQDLPSVITAFIEKLVNEIAYRSLDDRLKFLTERFGIDFGALDSDLDTLKDRIELRNRIIHTVSLYEYGAVTNRTVGVKETQRHIVPWAIAEDTHQLVLRVIKAVSVNVSKRIFGREPVLVVPTFS